MAPGASRMRRSWYLEKIVSIKLGDIISADARLLEGDPSEIYQSHSRIALTKNPEDEVYSGSACKQGEITCRQC